MSDAIWLSPFSGMVRVDVTLDSHGALRVITLLLFLVIVYNLSGNISQKAYVKRIGSDFLNICTISNLRFS